MKSERNSKQEYFSDNYPDLDSDILYWLVTTEEIDESKKEWLEKENMSYQNVCNGGELGQSTIFVYKIFDSDSL